MHVMVIGAAGQLGAEICRIFEEVQLTRTDMDAGDIHLDIRDSNRVNRSVAEVHPDVVINTAAVHELILCENNPELAFSVNATAAMHVGRACAQVGARLIHISTDYVFGGLPRKPLRPYDEDDRPAPMNVYAASKLAGEHLVAASCPDHIIIRTAALYGLTPCRGKGGRNFVETMLSVAATQPEVKVVTDIITNPTYTVALARQVRLLAEKGAPGCYHATCTGECSWYEFAQAIFEETHTPAVLVAAQSTDFQSPVQRPVYAALDNKRLRDEKLEIMPSWREALREYAVARRSACGGSE